MFAVVDTRNLEREGILPQSAVVLLAVFRIRHRSLGIGLCRRDLLGHLAIPHPLRAGRVMALGCGHRDHRQCYGNHRSLPPNRFWIRWR